MKSSFLAAALAALVSVAPSAYGQTEILNASYDLSREFYGEFNHAFEAHYKKTAGKDVKVKQ